MLTHRTPEQEFISFLLDRDCPRDNELVTNEWHEDGTLVTRRTYFIQLHCTAITVLAERNPNGSYSLVKWSEVEPVGPDNIGCYWQMATRTTPWLYKEEV